MQDREDEAGDTGVDVDRGAAGVVLGADPAADERVVGAAEDHVRHREVAQERPERHEDHPGGELHPVGDRAADQRDGDDREGHLEHHADVGVGGDAVEPEQVERVGEERALPTEAHRPADRDVEDADDRHGDVRHHHHVEHGLGPGHAAVEQCQRGHGHHQDERRRDEHERVVAVHRTSIRTRERDAALGMTTLSLPVARSVAQNLRGGRFRGHPIRVAGMQRVPGSCYFRVTARMRGAGRRATPDDGTVTAPPLRARLGAPGHRVVARRVRPDPTPRRCCAAPSTRACTRSTSRLAGDVAVGQGRRCEVAVVRLAGAVDEAGYLAHNAAQAERGAEPVEHFCRRGWRGLRNPSLDFDLWWYWAEYLDPTDESETAINPLVHYLLDGRHRGLLPLPHRRLRPATTVPAAPATGLPVRSLRPGRAGRRLRRGVRRRAGPARRRVRAGRRRAGARPAGPAVRVGGRRVGRARTEPTTSDRGACSRASWSAGPRSRRTTRCCWPTTRAGCCGRSTRSSRGWTRSPATSGGSS